MKKKYKKLKKKQLKSIAVLAIAILLIAFGKSEYLHLLLPQDQSVPASAVQNEQSIQADTNNNTAYEQVEVVRIVDGDTLVVLRNGVEEKVRLIGVNTPESVGKYKNNPQPGGVEASNFLKELLPEGMTVYMTQDIGDRDKYQRLLRYVWLQEPHDENPEFMVNYVLLEKGYAGLMTIPPNVKYVDLFTSVSEQGSI